MIRAAGLALFSALLGGAIALLAQKRPAVLERTRTFAFAAAAGVVAFHLLPEVLPAQGLRALLWMGFGFALPWALEAGARLIGPGLLEARGLTGLRVAAEVGFAALIFHSVAEGLALVAALAQPRGQLDLEIALVAHHAPLTAAVVLPFLDVRGPGVAWRRAVMVGAAGVAGVLLSDVVPGFGGGDFLLSATAATAGALLHVVSDEIRAQKFVSRWERAADVGACLAGLAVAGLGALLHLRSQEAGPLLEFVRVFCGLAIACAPALLCGAAVAALLALPSRFLRWDALLLALVLLGPLPAVLFGTLSTIFALPVTRSLTPPGVLGAVVDSVRRHAPRLLLLLVIAAGLEVSRAALPAGLLPRAALALALLSAARLDPAGAIAVAAVLVRKGFDPGLAMGLVALGPISGGVFALVREMVRGGGAEPSVDPARDVETVRGVEPAREFEAVRGVRVWRLALFAALALGAAPLFSDLLLAAHPAVDRAFAVLRSPLPAQLIASPAGVASSAVLVALSLATLWEAGVRGWFAPLRHGAT